MDKNGIDGPTPKKESTIILLRVFAMVMIIATHLCQFYEWTALESLLFGVPLFLCISGYIYGLREEIRPKDFFRGRIVKFLVPIWLFELFVFLYASIVEKQIPSLLDVVMHITNLQGIWNLCSFVKYYPFSSCAILWFTTVIGICYLFLPIVQKIPSGGVFAVSLLSIIICTALAFCGINIHYLIIYFAGYYFAKKRIAQKCTKKTILISFILLVVVWISRLIARKYIDGTSFYDKVIAPYSHDILALWFLNYINWLVVKNNIICTFVSRVAKNKVILWADKTSMSVYVVHYLFFHGFWSVDKITNNPVIKTILLIAFTIPTAMIFNKICMLIQEKVSKQLLWSKQR